MSAALVAGEGGRRVSAVRYAPLMFDVTLAPADVGASLDAARLRLERTLVDAEQLAPLVLNRRDAGLMVIACKDMRACAEDLVRGVALPRELLTSDELVGADRSRLRSGLDDLLVRFQAMTAGAQTLVDELRKHVRFRASA